MTQRDAMHVYEFGGFRLDPLRRVLSRENSEPIAMKPKLLDALLYLVEHAGEPLDKSELIAGIWPGLVVEENNLNKTISVLRRALGETPDDHKFIVTEPGRGYRFVAPVSRRARDADEQAPAATFPSVTPPPPPRTRNATLRYAGAAAIAAAAATVLIASYFREQPPESTPHAVRFQIDTAKTLNPLNIAVSPDGKQIAYVGDAERGIALWVRPLDSLDARVVRGAEGVSETSYPFWSTDGSEIVYRTMQELKRVSLAGGLANAIVNDIKLYRRGAWGADGTILYATEKVVHRVPAAGGESVPVTTLNLAAGEEAHSAPQFLPDGKHFLYKATNIDWRKGAIYVGSLDHEEPPRRLLEASRALYVEPVTWSTPRKRAVRAPVRRRAARAHGTACADRRRRVLPRQSRHERLRRGQWDADLQSGCEGPTPVAAAVGGSRRHHDDGRGPAARARRFPPLAGRQQDPLRRRGAARRVDARPRARCADARHVGPASGAKRRVVA